MSAPYFDLLFPRHTESGQDVGYACLSLYPKGEFTRTEGPTQQHFYSWPSEREKLIAFCLSNREKDIYAVPALFRTRSNRKAANIVYQSAVYADTDALDLSQLKAEPTLIVETSEGRHHAYWMTDSNDVHRCTEISRAIALSHADAGCDKGGWDAGQLLRVPGSTNSKYRDSRGPFEVRIVRTAGQWTLEKLEAIYPPVPAQRGDDALPPRSEWFQSVHCIEEAEKIFRRSAQIKALASTPLVPGQDRSKTLYRLLSAMARQDVPKQVAMHIAWDATCNKFIGRRDGESDLWRALTVAYEDPANEAVTSSVVIPNISAPFGGPVADVGKILDSSELLTADERQKLPHDTFLDRYVTWASGRTDAPIVYHRAGAVSMLSTLLGEFGACPIAQESNNLCIWFLQLGPTTRARKTTAMMMWIRMLSDTQERGFRYILGSDVTVEGLDKVLLKRDGRSSVIYRDELHGWLYEQAQKKYLSGVREFLTELFSGWVRKSIRAHSGFSDEEDEEEFQESIKLARTNCVLFLCGTFAQATEALQPEDYESGHLTRFLVANADPPQLTKKSIRMEQCLDGEEGSDAMRDRLIADLVFMRTHWLSICGRPGKLKKIPFDADAWDRMEEARWHMYSASEGHKLASVLAPTADRMGSSIMKTAILLAMSDARARVHLEDVLKALSIAEDWYSGTMTMAASVMQSSWAERQEAILTKIGSRPDGVSESELYRYLTTMYSKTSDGSSRWDKDIESDLRLLMKQGFILKFPTPAGQPRYRRVRFVD